MFRGARTSELNVLGGDVLAGCNLYGASRPSGAARQLSANAARQTRHAIKGTNLASLE